MTTAGRKKTDDECARVSLTCRLGGPRQLNEAIMACVHAALKDSVLPFVSLFKTVEITTS